MKQQYQRRFGFMLGKSTMEAIFLLKCLMKNYK